MQIVLAVGPGEDLERRRVRCAGCRGLFRASLADPGDELVCPHCGDAVVMGHRAGRVRRRSHEPRTPRRHDVPDPLRVVRRCAVAAVLAVAAYLCVMKWDLVVGTFVFLQREIAQLTRGPR